MSGADHGSKSPEPAADQYLAHLDTVTDGAEPQFHPVGDRHPDRPRPAAIIYQDLPEPGELTAFTYGLSLHDHTAWRHAKPELMITVRSRDINWGLALASMVNELGGRAPFSYGDTITFGQVSPESAMTAFLIFAPTVLAPEDYRYIDIGTATITLACCYPIHASEQEFIARDGFEAFWKLKWDSADVTRPPAV